MYTAYELIEGVMTGEGRDKYFLGFFMIAFAVIGILLVIYSGRDMMRGKYVGGELDACDEEEEEEIVEAEELGGKEESGEVKEITENDK